MNTLEKRVSDLEARLGVDKPEYVVLRLNCPTKGYPYQITVAFLDGVRESLTFDSEEEYEKWVNERSRQVQPTK